MKLRYLLALVFMLQLFSSMTPSLSAEETTQVPTLAELKATGPLRSRYLHETPRPISTEAPNPRLKEFREKVGPILTKVCVDCHGPYGEEGNIRVDELDPDLLHGDDVAWWLEVLAAVSKGEMPPSDAEELADEDRAAIVDWLTTEIQVASTVRRAEEGHSSFRRLTRYETNYALQDLLGLPYDFARDLPPDSTSEDGFQNSSEMLGMSAVQFGFYRDLARTALRKATVRGEKPDPIYWEVSMKEASKVDFAKQAKSIAQWKKELKDNPEELEKRIKRITTPPREAYYLDQETGHTVGEEWAYYGAKYAWKPSAEPKEVPEPSEVVAVIPRGRRLIVELGDTVPETGMLRVRIRASRASLDNPRLPSLQLEFGWQASNDSHASVRVGGPDMVIDAEPGDPKFYEWVIPMSEVQPRNSMRGTWKLGDLPNPSEFLKLVNSSLSPVDVHVEHVSVSALVYDQWPPESHTRIFFDSEQKEDETEYARQLLTQFMTKAWRRPVTNEEVEQKLALLTKIRPQCDDFEDAMIEVLATVLSSPQFLYLIPAGADDTQDDYQLATRLSIFLWCTIPDDPLLALAGEGKLSEPDVLNAQIDRMLADPRAERFSQQFVRQWLGMQLLDYLNVDRKVYPRFDPNLKEAMIQEPVALFQEVLENDQTVLDFIHADYAMVNERLAKHYGLQDVYGNEFRRVELPPKNPRGGLLTQAGLLAMNSDGKDSHPLKRGIWVLKSLLNDPPPPPPAAVPIIDLADPEIAKMTLKERIENHRNQPACNSCHAKIDPWGIAFENFDAVGSWRTKVDGRAVDASSKLFNKREIDGIEGLKRFLLEDRQDQFAQAVVHKLTTYALGRPLTFGDRAEVDQITTDLRKQGDGLATAIKLIAASDLFQQN